MQTEITEATYRRFARQVRVWIAKPTNDSRGLEKVETMTDEELIEIMKAAGARSPGGAGSAVWHYLNPEPEDEDETDPTEPDDRLLKACSRKLDEVQNLLHEIRTLLAA